MSDLESKPVKDMVETSEDSEQDLEERADEYCKDGYALVRIGDRFIKRYRAIRKLGWGAFSTVWLCNDLRKKEYVAIKVTKGDEELYETASDEIDLLYEIKELAARHRFGKRVLSIRNDFEFKGPNGRHMCMISEVLGESLYGVIFKHFKNGIPIAALKPIVKQILEGLFFLHYECGLIHTDIKPENILLTVDKEEIVRMHRQVEELMAIHGEAGLPDSFISAPVKKLQKSIQDIKSKASGQNNQFTTLETDNILKGDILGAKSLFGNDWSKVSIKIADLGNAYYIDELRLHTIQTRPYRSPEVVLGQGFGTSADIWSLACTAFELATGQLLFDYSRKGFRHFSKTDMLLYRFIELLGPIPKSCRRGKYYRKHLNRSGKLSVCRDIPEVRLQEVLVNRLNWQRSEADGFVDFLLPMLRMNPRKRATARKCLRHEWLNQ